MKYTTDFAHIQTKTTRKQTILQIGDALASGLLLLAFVVLAGGIIFMLH